jgi:hypothetical protein
MNCAELVEVVQKKEFRREFKFPQSNGNVFTESKQIKKEFEKYVIPKKAEVLEDGDLVLMNAKHEMAHVGVLCIINSKLYVLHSLKTAGCVCMHRIGELKTYGLYLKGVYKWQK